MPALVKDVLRLLLPPVIVIAWRRLRLALFPPPPPPPSPPPPPPEWEMVSEGWNYPVRGWNHQSVVDIQEQGWQAFIESLAAPRPFGAARASQALPQNYTQHNILMTFAYVLARAGAGGTLRLLDWGGGLGQYFHIARNLYPSMVIDYTCKEVTLLATAGSRLTPQARFTDRDDVALASGYDLVFASGALQYMRDFESDLVRLCHAARGWLMVTRVPLVDEREKFVVLQRPYIYGYETEYLGWVFNKAELVALIESQGFRLEREFLLDNRLPVAGVDETIYLGGLLFQRRD